MGPVATTQDYVEPDELIGDIVRDPLPLDPRVLHRFTENGVDCSEVDFVSEVIDGEEIRMHAWLARPAQGSAELPPVLVIPGGRGHMPESEFARWVASECQVAALAVDWIGAGRSSSLPDCDPWRNAMLFDGPDYRSSYQYHNLRGLLRATAFLLAQPQIDESRLMALGSSWGSFYSWLLAGADDRFTQLFLTFGCGFLDVECHQVWESFFETMGPERKEEWLRAFDPGRRVHLVKANVFYQHATNDKFYSLLAGMLTYDRLTAPKRLVLTRNQDHFIEPFRALDVKALRSAVNGTDDEDMPRVDAVRWIPDSNLVEVEAVDPENLKLSVVWSAGSYTKSFGRYWREEPVELRDGRWVAEIPVVDVDREIWFYGHAVAGDPPFAASTSVERVVPSEQGLREPTAEFDPSFDLASEPFWDLPIGDRQHPETRLVEEDGVLGLALQFDSDPSRRGIVYCLEGDLLAENGYNAIEIQVKVPLAKDVTGLKLCLVTDFHSLSEQTYVVDLDALGLDFTSWQTVRLPFSSFRPTMHRVYYSYRPPLQPMDVSRLCGVGLFHSDQSYAGEPLISGIKAIRIDGAPDEPMPVEEVVPEWSLEEEERQEAAAAARARGSAPAVAPADLDPYDLFVETDLDPEWLRMHLRQWEPWRHEIIFSNGVRTSQLRTTPTFFVQHLLAKWHVFQRAIPDEALRAGRALDVGSNIGHFSVFLRQRYGMEVVGLETNSRDLAVARFLRDSSKLDGISFVASDANTYLTPESFDLILHLGTLDHLKSPALALENASAMLAPNGYLALELQTYKNPTDEHLCLFLSPDPTKNETCWWFLGKAALLEMLDAAGFDRVEVLLEWSAPEVIGPDMRRLSLIARKPGA